MTAPSASTASTDLRVAYVTSYDARDRRQWSGTGYHIAEALARHSVALDYVGPLPTVRPRLQRARERWHRLVSGKRYLADRHPTQIGGYASHVASRLTGSRADVVFSPGTLPIALLACRQPIAFWTDATFGAMLDFYPEFSAVHRRSVRHGMTMENAALARASLAIYSSDWAARSAVELHGADPARVKVVPFGANIDAPRTRDEIRRLVRARPSDRCDLLFAAVDWTRKGGQVAVETAERLTARGLPTTLQVLGCVPPPSLARHASVQSLGFVSKTDPAGAARIDALFAQSHFLILPSVADCTPVVLSEACAFGLPCLTTTVGGIPSIVRNDVNGCTFPPTAGAASFADYIDATLKDRGWYERLALSAFDEYRRRLNWEVAGHTVKQLLVEVAAAGGKRVA